VPRRAGVVALAMAGETQDVIRDVLGHQDIRMTIKYTHLMPGRTKSALGKLDRFSKRNPGNPPPPAPGSGLDAAAEGG
jgi:integrase